MTATLHSPLAERLVARFGDTLKIEVVRNETIAEVTAADLVAVAVALRDEPSSASTS